MPTIVPYTKETEWLPTFQGVPVWNPPLLHTVILSPHPDDETLGAGGLIARLRAHDVPVTVIAITDGESAYSDTARLGEVRVREQVEALGRLNVAASMVHRLRLPDGLLSSHEAELLELLRPLVSEGMHIIAPWPLDFHPDHEAAGRAAERLGIELGLTVSFYLFWTWHRSAPNLLEGLPLVALQLTELERETKLHALEAHESQLSHPDGQPILSRDLLAPARRTFEVYIQ